MRPCSTTASFAGDPCSLHPDCLLESWWHAGLQLLLLSAQPALDIRRFNAVFLQLHRMKLERYYNYRSERPGKGARVMARQGLLWHPGCHSAVHMASDNITVPATLARSGTWADTPPLASEIPRPRRLVKIPFTPVTRMPIPLCASRSLASTVNAHDLPSSAHT